MRVLEAGGTVEQHKAAVAAATAMKFDGNKRKCHLAAIHLIDTLTGIYFYIFRLRFRFAGN